MKAPYKVLFSNDTTNIECCVSPYHRKGERFRSEMLEASVAETAGKGVDVHMLQPGLCNAPWWQSKINPPKEHYAWAKSVYGGQMAENGYMDYLLAGGDLVADFTVACRKHGMAPFVSFRVNDSHHKQLVDADKSPGAEKVIVDAFDRFYKEHPELRIGDCLRRWDLRVYNWIFPEVRRRKLALIEELCENYDIDGFELDFMRFSNYFDVFSTNAEERVAIMVAFVKAVRAALDRTAQNGQRRWLCVRIPQFLELHGRLGIDMPRFAAAGVDMFNLSSTYLTDQQSDLTLARKLVPDASLFLEMTNTVSLGQSSDAATCDGDNYSFRRTTCEQLHSTAHLAYARGADGVSLFNFVYYRQHGEGSGRGPFHEPPFDALEKLSDPAWLAQRPQHYFLGYSWEDWPKRQVPRTILLNGQWLNLLMDMEPAPKAAGVLRFHMLDNVRNMDIDLTLNGKLLKRRQDVSEPFENDYPKLSRPEQIMAWDVPSGAARSGVNVIEGRYVGKDMSTLLFVDLALNA